VRTLRLYLRAKAIEPDSAETGYSLKQAAMTPEEGNPKEESLRAHARLQIYQVDLAELKLAKEKRELILREEPTGSRRG
jgi:hypothetical protein